MDSGDVKKFINSYSVNKGTWHIDRQTNSLYLHTDGGDWTYNVYCK